VALFLYQAHAGEVAISIDDFHLKTGPLMDRRERDEKILNVLAKHKVQAALFLSCQYLEIPESKARLPFWEKAGHLIGNHTYSHWFYNEKGFVAFSKDIKKCHEMIKGYKTFAPLFRFPFLKGGKTTEQRDSIQKFLKDLGYKNGYVTIDASDWYISSKLEEAIRKNPKADLKPYRDFYLDHMWEKTLFYDALGKKYWKTTVKHNVLIHHNLLNSLFLEDLIQMYKNKGWKIISAAEAFKDPLYDEVPNVIPHGESILLMLAKKAGDKSIRYPGEDAKYEKATMKKLGL
jgi:peptidoglycan-N-acetylglucosamine deacetylase